MMPSNIKELRIRKFSEYFKCVSDMANHWSGKVLWWRGLGDARWRLQASIDHQELRSEEESLFSRFTDRYWQFQNEGPKSNFAFEMLWYQRHYGLPNRLLDWTRAPLTALYFALNSSAEWKKDGVVWCLSPGHLNLAMGHGDRILGLGDEAFKTATNLRHHSGIAAIRSSNISIRQTVQLSEFTSHASAEPLESNSRANEFLGKIVIPAELKEGMYRFMFYIGINRESLFPDAENVARNVVEEIKLGKGEQPNCIIETPTDSESE